jgi:hypothetical protein
MGRYPSLGFAALALMLTALWWFALGTAAGGVAGLFSSGPKIPGEGPRIELFSTCITWIRWSSYVVLPLLCCHVAARYCCGWRAALWACQVLAIHNGLHLMKVSGDAVSGTVEFGYTFSTRGPALFPLLLPLALFALWRFWSLRQEKEPGDSGPNFC